MGRGLPAMLGHYLPWLEVAADGQSKIQRSAAGGLRRQPLQGDQGKAGTMREVSESYAREL